MFQRPNGSTAGFLRIGGSEYPITRDGLRDAFASQLDDQAHLNKGDVYMLAMLVGEELCRHNLKDVDGKTSACEMTLGKLDERTVGAYVREAYILRRACQLMQYTEEGEALGIMLYQCSMPINAAECVLMGRARRMRAAETRQKLDDYYAKLREKGDQVTFSTRRQRRSTTSAHPTRRPRRRPTRPSARCSRGSAPRRTAGTRATATA